MSRYSPLPIRLISTLSMGVFIAASVELTNQSAAAADVAPEIVINSDTYSFQAAYTCFYANVTSSGVIVQDRAGQATIHRTETGVTIDSPDRAMRIEVTTVGGQVGRIIDIFGESGVVIEARVKKVVARLFNREGKQYKRAVQLFSPPTSQ